MAKLATSSRTQRGSAGLIFQSWANLCRDFGAVQERVDGACLHVYPNMPRGGNFNNLIVPRPRRAKLAGQIAKAASVFRLHGVPGAIYVDGPEPPSQEEMGVGERLVPRPAQALMLLRVPARFEWPAQGPIIRNVRASELEEYTRLIVTSFEWDEHVLQPFHEVLRRIHRHPHFRCLAVLDQGKLIGSTILHIDSDLASVNEVATLPEFRGHGIATSLVCAAVELAVRSKRRRVWLRCVHESPAQRLYMRLRFKLVTVLNAFRVQ